MSTRDTHAVTTLSFGEMLRPDDLDIELTLASMVYDPPAFLENAGHKCHLVTTLCPTTLIASAEK